MLNNKLINGVKNQSDLWKLYQLKFKACLAQSCTSITSFSQPKFQTLIPTDVQNITCCLCECNNYIAYCAAAYYHNPNSVISM